MASFNHVTVLLNEAVAGLNIKPGGTYVDGTLGGGGHTSKILGQLTTGHLYSFDQDETAIAYNREHLKPAIDAGKRPLLKTTFATLLLPCTSRGWRRSMGSYMT